MKKILMLAILLFSLSSFAYADVGVGVSPSKIVLQIEGGEVAEYDLLVFNSGDQSMKIRLESSKEIADFIQIEPTSQVIEPEPKPHALPIKNGKNFKVTFSPPAIKNKYTYTGTISATGSAVEGSQFGGSVGVATQVELIVTPTSSIFAFINTIHLLIAGIIIVLVLTIYMLKRAGLEITFKKKGY